MNVQKHIVVLVVACLFSCPSISNAQVEDFTAKELTSFSLDQLFSVLGKATKESQARLIENQIWQSWLKAESDEIDYLMNDAYYFRREYNLDSAIESLNEVIEKRPEYSEAWNQRAIAYFYKGKLDLALSDIEKTLMFEPRHFGAMAGRAVIHLKLNQTELAKQSILQAIAIHPFLPERSLFPELSAPPQ